MRQHLTTSLNELRKHDPCVDGYKKLVKFLGVNFDVNAPINLLTILKSNGIEDCLWALRATFKDSKTVARLIAADCAESVLYIYAKKYPNDDRPKNAIAAARNLTIDPIARAAATDAARAAAWAAADDADAAYAAYAAAWAAADDAAWAAADGAARAAYAADAADAVYAAARAAARAAEKNIQAQIIEKYLMTDEEFIQSTKESKQ